MTQRRDLGLLAAAALASAAGDLAGSPPGRAPSSNYAKTN
jgi:hypothetical protein